MYLRKHTNSNYTQAERKCTGPVDNILTNWFVNNAFQCFRFRDAVCIFVYSTDDL